MTETTGSCLCGAITYRVTGPLRPVVGCHCVQCRKTSGHYVAATSARREDVTVKGEVRWFHASETARRGFCRTCGSNLFWDPMNGTTLSIHAGTLDGATGLALKGHIYTADMGDYYTLDDGLPQAPGRHPDLTTQG